MRLKIFLFIILSFICSSHLFANENKSFSLPKENWGVVVDLSGFSVINNSFGNNGNERDITIEAGKKITGSLNISTIEKTASDCCNDFINSFNSQENNIISIEQTEIDDISYVYYNFETLNGDLLKGFACFLNENNKSANIFLLAQENASSFFPASQRILMSFKLIEDYQPHINERIVFGKYYYENQDFFSALDIFEPILKNNLLQKVLSDEDYRTLVNISSSAYNIVGLPELGIKLLDEGICRLPEDSMFYYNLASIYALYGVEDKVFSNLEKAYRFKAKNMSVAGLPNPLQDSAFQNFLMSPNNYQEVSNLLNWFAIP